MHRHQALGLLLIALGGLFLLSNLGIFPVSVWSLWPLLFFVPALQRLLWHLRCRSGSWGAIAFLLLVLAWSGTSLAHNLGLLPVDGGEVLRFGWPILLVGLGLGLLTGRPEEHRRLWWDSFLDTRRIGDFHYGTRPWVFDDLEVSQVAGDVSVDLTTATIRPGDHRLVVDVVLGEVTIWLPEDVDAEVSARVYLGDLRALGHRRSGIGNALEVTEPAPQPGPEPKRVQIRAELLAGQLTIRRVSR